MLPKNVLDPFPLYVGLVGAEFAEPCRRAGARQPQGGVCCLAQVSCGRSDTLGVGGRCLWVCQGSEKIFLKKD